jgi:hypothetical protein
MTPAERQRACRARKAAAKAGTKILNPPVRIQPPVTLSPVSPKAAPVTIRSEGDSSVSRIRLRAFDASTVLTAAAFASAAVGMVMNGWYARSLGSSDVAGWLFLAIGVVADAVALAVPVCCARLSAKRQRGAAALGWLVWAATFLFAVCAGIGFASTNIQDVTLSRASRVTPAVTAAEVSLRDVMTSRDRECVGGVGKYCREREAAVTVARQTLEAARQKVEQAADPQTEAATRIVAWLSRGTLVPTSDDFAMLRLVLLALLPQVGGILLMVGRGAR